MNHDISELRDFLESIQPGPVPQELKEELIALLEPCWHIFVGSHDSSMDADKIDRMEAPKWSPPNLSFIIERHGATTLGSTRAELQGWLINLDEGTASCSPAGYRQVKSKAAPWKAGPIGEELARLILEGKEDPRLKWLNKSKVILQTQLIIPGYSFSPKETLTYRRKRLYEAMEKLLTPSGWQRTRNIWEKAT